MARIAFIINGKVRGKEKLWKGIRESFRPRHEIKPFPTEKPLHGRALAIQAIEEGFTHLISVGGDGSLNDMVNGVMQARETLDKEKSADLVLGVLPKGTGNDFARSLGSPSSPAGLLKKVEAGSLLTTDIGLVNYTGRDGEPAKRYFINITDIGMGGEAVERISRFPSAWGKTLAYQQAILRTFLSFRHQPVEVQADTFTFSGRIMSLIIAKGQYFGNGLGIAPHARLDDGNLAVVVLGQITLMDYLKHFRRIRNGEVLEHPKVSYYHAKHLNVVTPDGPLPIDMDGDFVGYTPMGVKVLPGALPFLGKI